MLNNGDERNNELNNNERNNELNNNERNNDLNNNETNNDDSVRASFTDAELDNALAGFEKEFQEN